LGIWLSFGAAPACRTGWRGREGWPRRIAQYERIVREHVTAATAALVQPGGGRAALWQTAPPNAISQIAGNARSTMTGGKAAV